MTFKLDTSGVVHVPVPRPSAAQPYIHTRQQERPVRWSDLDPFTQGYIEALFADPADHVACLQLIEPLAFTDLAPETLARIIEDGAAVRRLLAASNTMTGAQFWGNRQRGVYDSAMFNFPPLTVTLGDDGKVRFQ